jgi:HK97 family phage portal protein
VYGIDGTASNFFCFIKINYLNDKLKRMALFQSKKELNPVRDYSQAIDKVMRSLSAYFGNTISWIPDKFDEYIKNGYFYNADVYTVVSFITRKVSGIPWQLYQVKDKKQYNRYKSMRNPISLKYQVSRVKSMDEITHGDAYDILQNPNKNQSIDAFVSEAVGFLALTGNMYWYAFKPTSGINRGKVTQLINLPSQIVQIVNGTPANPIEGYKVLYNQEIKYAKEEIYHGKFFNPDYSGDPSASLYGLSPLRAASRLIYTSNEAITANAKILKHLGAVGMITPDGMEVTQTQAQALQDSIEQKYNNPDYYGKKPFSSIPVKWVNFGMSVEDMAVMELQRYSFAKICNIYGLDPHLFGSEQMRDNNKVQAAKDAWYNCLMYYLDFVKEGLNKTIASSWGDDLHIDYDISAVEELQKEMGQIVEQASKMYWTTINEKRVLTNYDTVPDGDVYALPAGLILQKTLEPRSLQGLLSGIGEYGQKDI